MDRQLVPTLRLPHWLPDETVFSWASRYHRLAGNRLAEETCMALFGDRRHGAQHDFPTRLGRLAAATAGQLGDAAGMALNHTLLRYYLVTRQPNETAAAIASLAGSSAGALKFRLGILTSRFRANHPLKACPACIQADAAARGSPYWRLPHQYPGVWICLQHGMPLQVSTVKSNGINRFGWVLPADAGLAEIVPTGAGAALSRFSMLVAGWSALSPGALTPSGIAAACRMQLNRSSSSLKRPNRTDAGASLANAIAELREVPELQALPSNSAQGKAELDRWVFAPRGGTHPLRHLAIIYWLFPSWPEFITTYAEAQTPAKPAAHTPLSGELADTRRMCFVAELTAGRSVTAASKRVGITVSTGIAWAAQHGFNASRRPKTMAEPLQRAIADELARGDEKAEIAERHQVSVQAVTRVLRSEVGLADRRRRAQHESTQLTARQAWRVASDAWPGATVAHLRKQAGAAYAWLRRHDKTWLDANLPRRPRQPPTVSRVDWDSRDVELAAAVRRVAAELAAVLLNERLRPWQIFQALPELKAKQSAFARLPLTARALDEVTRRVRASGHARSLDLTR